MTKQEFLEGIYMLQDNYNKKFTGTQLRLYYENLKDMNKDMFLRNIKEIIKTSSYMPTIAEIRNEKRKEYSNYQQRDYSKIDLNKLYAN